MTNQLDLFHSREDLERMEELHEYTVIAGDKYLASWIHGIENVKEAKQELKTLRQKIK